MGVLIAFAVVLVLGLLAGSAPYTALGNTDPGPLVRLGAPVLRLVVDLAGTLTTGSLAFAALCTRPRGADQLTPVGYAALRSAGWSAAGWAVAALVLVPFDAADTSGQPLADVLAPSNLFGLIGALEEPKAWLVTVVLAAAVAIGCRTTLHWRPVFALLTIGGFALLPALATGHSASDADHDIATAAIMIHIPAAAIWLGVLVSYLRHAHHHRAEAAALGRRYARVAAVCWVVLVASGLVDAAILVPASELFSTAYGLTLTAKALVAVVVGLATSYLRRRALAAERGGLARLLTLGGVELVALLGIVGLSVQLSHLPPPAFVGHPVTADQTLLGYDLTAPPTLARLLLDWRIDALFLPVTVLLAAGYLFGVHRLRQRKAAWPIGRTAAWLAGCAVLLFATSSGVGRYAAAMFSVHIASHMLIGMVAPMLFALGGPLTLLDQVVRAGPTGLPGGRDWLTAFRDSGLARAVTHPVVALGVFAGAPFALYFTGLFDAAVRFHWAHLLIDVVFSVIGYVFAWTVIGVDPTPRQLPSLARLGMLLAAMPFDIVFGALLISTHTVIGNGRAGDNMYQALALPWVPSLLADQRTAGEISLVIGELALLFAIGVLVLRWQRVDDDLEPDADVLAALARRRELAR